MSKLKPAPIRALQHIHRIAQEARMDSQNTPINPDVLLDIERLTMQVLTQERNRLAQQQRRKTK